MNEEYRIEDLAADEFAELLAEQGEELSPEQAIALKQLLTELGDLDHALAVVNQLRSMNRAA